MVDVTYKLTAFDVCLGVYTLSRTSHLNYIGEISEYF